MKYYVEESLSDFDFREGAADRAKNLDSSELDRFEDMISDYIGDEPSQTDINDFFWFDFKEVCHALGYACDDADDPVRDVEDFSESFRIEVLTDYVEAAGWKATPEQIQALDEKCIEEGDAYELNAEEDTFDIDDSMIEDYAKAVGIVTEEEE